MNRVALRCTRRLCCAAAVWLASVSLSSAAQAQDFIKTLITHVGGGAGSQISRIDINDNNWVVWARGLTNASQVTLWNGQTIQNLGVANGNNRDPRINNNNKVVWSGLRTIGGFDTDIYLWNNGVVTNLTQPLFTSGSSALPFINDLDDMAFAGPGLFAGDIDLYYKAHDGNQWRNLTAFDPDGNHSGPVLNNTGKISWDRTIDTSEGGRTDIYIQSLSDLISSSSFASATIVQGVDLNVYNGDLNDNGVAVWQGYDSNNWDIFLFDPALPTPVNLTPTLNGSFGSYQPVINNAGVTVWYRWRQGNLYDLYWRVGSTTAIIPLSLTNTRNVPVAINNNGALAYATGDSTQGYDIYLAVPARSLSGTVALQSAVTNAVPLIFTFRPQSGASFNRTVTPAANGAFTIGGLPAGNYTVSVKGSKWLRTNFSANLTASVNIGIIEFKGGDANDDNTVDIADLLILIGAYNKVSPNSGYLEAADFTNNGTNDIADLLVLISNYNKQGDGSSGQ